MCKLLNEVREKMESYGVSVVGDYELLAAILGISPTVLASTGLTMQEILEHPAEVKGIGGAKVKAVEALREMVRRISIRQNGNVDILHGPEDAAHYLAPRIGNESKEHFVVLLLNTKNHIIKHEVVSIGSLTASVVHPREVFEMACKFHAASIILAHNHPSGNPSPSREDIALTQRLVKAGKVMDILVLDHIIIGGNTRFYSLKESGQMG